MFRMGSVDCEEYETICAKEKVAQYPLLRVYPAFPAPTQDYEEEALDTDKLKKLAGKFLSSRAVELT